MMLTWCSHVNDRYSQKVLISILPTQTTDERNEATVHDRNFVEGLVVYTLLRTFCITWMTDFFYTANVTTGILTASFSWLLLTLIQWEVKISTDANTTPGLFALAWPFTTAMTNVYQFERVRIQWAKKISFSDKFFPTDLWNPYGWLNQLVPLTIEWL
ncbi:hypothetical protein V8E54_000844 [Elaphomyces granulatus]